MYHFELYQSHFAHLKGQLAVVNFAVLCLSAYTDSYIAVSLTVCESLLMDNFAMESTF